MTNFFTNTLTKSLTNPVTSIDTNDAAMLIAYSSFLPVADRYDGSAHEEKTPNMLYTIVGNYAIYADGDYFEFVDNNTKDVRVYKLVEIVSE